MDKIARIKWLAILSPAVLVAVCEYVRHNFMMQWLSMEAGNWLTAGVALVSSYFYFRALFRAMERMQAEMEEKRRQLAVLEERDRIARDLHDGICQALFFANVKLKAAEEKLHSGDMDTCAAELGEGRAALRSSYDDVRQAIFNLRMASGRTLPAALSDYLDEFRRQTGLQVALAGDGLQGFHLTPDEESNLLRIIQEALWNVCKHAGAERVEIAVERAADGLQLTVRDDGRGFAPEAVAAEGRRRFGLTFMAERAHRLGGRLEVRAAPGAGTEVRLEVPATRS